MEMSILISNCFQCRPKLRTRALEKLQNKTLLYNQNATQRIHWAAPVSEAPELKQNSDSLNVRIRGNFQGNIIPFSLGKAIPRESETVAGHSSLDEPLRFSALKLRILVGNNSRKLRKSIIL